MVPLWLYLACLGAAAVYASVGLGGGSAYLAFIALTNIETEQMRVAVLVMNIVVAALSFRAFQKAGHLRMHLLVPFLITSIPAAFVGGLYRVGDQAFQLLLAGSLAVVAARMLLWRQGKAGSRAVSWALAWRLGPIVGGLAGFLAGLVGIGGGIFLGPILIVMGWATAKQAAAVAAVFVWINSAAGLVAHVVRGNLPEPWVWPLVGVVLVGGLVGGRVGATKLSPLVVQRLFGTVVVAVVIRLSMRAFS